MHVCMCRMCVQLIVHALRRLSKSSRCILVYPNDFLSLCIKILYVCLCVFLLVRGYVWLCLSVRIMDLITIQTQNPK
jgi:hypothetical protein